MIWMVLIIAFVAFFVVLAVFNKRADDVQSELRAEDGGAPPPLFGAFQRGIPRNRH